MHTLQTTTYFSALAWAVSQDTDTIKNTKTSLTCCYALHIYVGLISSHDKLLA